MNGWTNALDPKNERKRDSSSAVHGSVSDGPAADATMLKRASAWLATVDPAIQGQGGSKPTFRAACTLVGEYKLSRSQALTLLETEYNPRCQPPWSRKELEHKINDAIEQTRGCAPVEDRPRPFQNVATRTAPSNDYEHTDADAPDAPPAFETNGMAEQTEQPTAEEPLRGLEHLGRVALLGRARILELAAKPIEYVWVDIAVAGTIILIAGPPAEGKTTLLFLILAARMNLGEVVSLLGRAIQPAPLGKFLVLIEGEHSEASTSRKLLKSLRVLKLDDAGLDRVIVVARKAVRLGSPEWSDVGRLVAAGLVSDIALDTVARVAPADANDEREQVALFDAVARTIELGPDDQPKPLVWAVAHTRKNNTDGGLGDVSGSAQRTGQADTVLMIKGEKVDGRTVSTTVTFAKLREDPDDYPMPVTFSITENGVELEDGRSDGKSDDRPLEERVLEALEAGPKTKNELEKCLKRSHKHIEEAVSNLFAARSIRTTTVERRGRSWKAFERCCGTPDRTPDSTNARHDTRRSSGNID